VIYMGHYFSNSNDTFSGMSGVAIHSFKKIISELQSDGSELILDDGLACHKLIARICLENNVKVACAIPSTIINKDEFLTVHKVHICLANLSKRDLKYAINSFFDYQNLSDVVLQNGIYSHQSSHMSEKVFKYLINYTSLDTEPLLNFLFNSLSSEVDFSDFYLNRNDISELSNEGVTILPHGVTHQNLCVLESLSEHRVTVEIKNSVNFANHYNPVTRFVLPYGTPNSISDKLLVIMRENGINEVLAALPDLSGYNLDKKEILVPRTDIARIV